MDQPRVRKTWIIGGWLACCCWAVPAVGQEGSDAWGAEIERWQHQLADPAPTYRVQAAAKLGRFGSDAAAAVDDLIAALEDSHPEVRMQAIVALVQIDARPLEVAQRLIACIGDPDEHVDYAAQWGLAHLSESLVRDHWNAAAELSVAEKVLSRAVDRCADSGGHPGQAARIGQQLHACRTRLVQLQTQQMRHQQIARARKHLRQIVEWMSAGRTLDHFRAIEELSPARLERNSWDDALDSDAVLRARIDILLALRNRHDPTMDRFLVKRWGAAFHDVAWMAMREALREDSASEVAEWLLWEIPIESDDDWREVLNLVGQADSHRIRRAAVAALERTAVRRGATILRLAEILADSGADAPSPSPARSEGGVAIPWLRSQEDTGAALQYPALDSLLGLLERAGPGELAAPVQRRVWEILLGVQGDSRRSTTLRRGATRALSLLRPDSLEAIQGYLEMAQERPPQDYELADALWAIERFDRAGMADALIERALGCDDDVARNKAIRLVRKLGDVSAQGLLLQRVADPLETPGNVDAAVEELSRIGPAAIGEVAKRARQQNPRHAVVTLHALTRWTAGCQSALPLYVEWAEDHDAPQELRCAALFCIARLGTDARSAAPQVRELLNHAPPGRIRAAALVALDALGALSAQELASAQASPIPELAIAADSIAAAAGNTLAVDRLVVRLRGPHWPMAAGALEDLGAKSLPGLKSAVFNSDLPDDLRLAALEVGLRTADTPLQTWGAVLHDPRIGDPSLWLFDAQLDTDRRVALVQYLTEASYRSSEAAFLGQLERLASQLSGPMGGGAGEGPLPSPSRLAAALMDLESFTHPWTAGMLPLPRAEESASPDAASEPPSDARTPTPPLIDPADPRRPSESASVSPVPTTRGDTERSPRSVEPPSLDVPDSWPPGAASGTAPSAVPLAVAPPASAAPPKFSRPEFPIEPRSGGAPAMLHNDRPADAQVAEPPDAPESEGRRAPGALVRVFYGTNRRPSAIANASPVRVEAVGVGFVLVYLGLAALFAILMLWNRVRMIAFVAMLLSLGLFAHRIESARFQPANSPPTENTGRTWYAADPSDELRLGVCQVSIPPVHRTGVVERPSVLRFQFRENPTQHVVIHEVREVDQERFFAELRDDARQRGGGVLVFIHGYNVRFDDAIMRTAQLAYDLDYSGTPVTFSWPSCGDWYKYQVDRRNIELSVPMIRRFLEDLARRSGARSIDVIAHSMGNVGLTQALVELSDTQPTPINNVVLAAPDIDAEVFETRIAPRLAGKARRFTLYTSNSDLALRASRYFNAGPRLGEALRPQPQYPGIEVIDATGFDTSLLGHSYYGSHAGILRDLYGLLRGEPIQQRSDVRVARTGDGTYRYIVRDASQASVAAPQVLQ